MTQTWSVKAVDLEKRFGDFVAVDRVTFQVRAGEIFGFVGSNGAGKSTTIRMLCGLLRPTGGEAWVNGFDVYREAEKIKASIGYMSQKFSLYEELTVEENINFFSGIYGVTNAARKRRREEILELIGLNSMREWTTRLLPGGWKQRLALGCAIIHQPPVIFLDEPTSGVDPLARREFWDLIYSLAGDGKTVFVTTHYMDEVENCHRVALMNAGKIIALDTPGDIRRHRGLGSLLEIETSDPGSSLEALKACPEVKEAGLFRGGLHLKVEDTEKARKAVKGLLETRGIRIFRLEEIGASIEDVFVYLMEHGGQDE